MKRGISNGAPGNENHIPTRSYHAFPQSQPNCFAHPTLDLIALHRVPNATADCETKTAVPQFTGKERHHHQWMENALSLATEALKVGIRSKTMLSLHGIAGPWALSPRPDAGPRYTVRRWRPLSRRAFKTARPPLVFIRSRKPCTRLRRRTLGCHVRFGIAKPLLSESQHAIIHGFAYRCKSVL